MEVDCIDKLPWNAFLSCQAKLTPALEWGGFLQQKWNCRIKVEFVCWWNSTLDSTLVIYFSFFILLQQEALKHFFP